MCDTFVALGNATCDGSLIFGKNSDREPNEAHELILFPHQSHPDGEQVACTHISIPQVAETNAVLLSKPFWIWGAEMGANEHGVVIGNEAVFTKVPYDKEPGLIGMDFLRLALERAATADQALQVMIDLLNEYGQGGNCGFAHPMFYHNSFLIADQQNAWVFETAGKQWAVEKVRTVRSISNAITIGSTWDRASEDLVTHAVSQGWCKDEVKFNFGQSYSDTIYTTFSDGRSRQCRTMDCLEKNQGKIDLSYAFELLRDHGADADENWRPGKKLSGATVCMHASFGPIRGSQTTGSFIAHLTPEGNTYWVTGTAAPCTSTFKPLWFEGGLPDLGKKPDGIYDDAAFWWRHEDLHRELLKDYEHRLGKIKQERDQSEAKLLNEVSAMKMASSNEKFNFSRKSFSESEQKEADWLTAIKPLPIEQGRPLLDKTAWKKFDREAQRIY